MQKVDRLGWADGFAVKTYGVKIGIRANNCDSLIRAWRHMPDECERVESPIVDRIYSIIIGGDGPRPHMRRFSLLYGDHQRLARSKDVDEVFDRFESDLRLFVAELAPRRVFVHAGVAAWKGKAIVIPGRSYSGKSTLVSELVKAGATYYSDEYAVFDSSGRVHPFSKPLEMREKGGFKQTKMAVESFGGKSGKRPIPVGLVLLTRFKAGAKWRPRSVTAGQAVLGLLANTVSARRRPERALATLQKAMQNAQALRSVRGNAKELARRILHNMEKNT